jgi:2-pyrone-4,6-dicarboxylate lactonase
MRIGFGVGGVPPRHCMPMTSRLRPGACNAHCHVFGPRDRFRYAADAPFVPAEDAPREALYELNDRLGLQRCVVVQSACHGFDNAVVEHAVAGRPADYRGIALLRPDASDAELRRLDRAGMRGVRFNFMPHLGRPASAEDVLGLADRLEPLGWHLQVHGAPQAVLVELGRAWRRSPVPVVVDHLGRVDAAAGEAGVHFRALLRLLDLPHVWVKVSGIERASRTGPPYADAQALARRLVADFGDRVLWGNDWPHPNLHGPMPDDAQLAELIHAVAPGAAALQRLMVDNPARLYRFGTLA